MLLLLPTSLEAARLLDGDRPVDERAVPSRVGGRRVRAALCGFGPAAAGVLATRALAEASPRRCLLVGLCGTYDAGRLPVGAGFVATEVRSDGIGRGEGAAHRGPESLGLPQAPGEAGREVYERLVLASLASAEGVVPGVLLSAAAAAGDAHEAAARRARHPDALAEDLEGFAVALAASRAGVPFGILRAVSNRVGDPQAAWDLSAAFGALRRLLEIDLGP